MNQELEENRWALIWWSTRSLAEKQAAVDLSPHKDKWTLAMFQANLQSIKRAWLAQGGVIPND